MVPTLTRRRLLGGAAAGAAGVAGLLALPPALLPDGVVDARMGLLDAPSFEWRPSVSAAHVKEGRTHLAEAVDRAEAAWEPIDRSALSGDRDGYDSHHESARSHLDAVTDAPASHEALFDVVAGLGDAGRAIGGARVVRGRADPQGLAERGAAIRESVAGTRDRLRYAVDDPARGLAHLHAVERQLAFARLDSHAGGVYAGGARPPSAYSEHTVVETWGAHRQARQHRRNAEQYYEAYRAGLDGPSPVGGIVADVLATFRAEAESTRQPRAVRENLVEGLPDEPYREVRFQLWQSTHGAVAPYTDDGPRESLDVYRAVSAAETALKLRAYDRATADLALSRGDDLDPAAVSDAKQRAVQRANAIADGVGSQPLARVLLRDAASMLESADRRLRQGSGEEPRWRSLARVYAAYLLAGAMFAEVGDVLAAFAGSGRS